MKEARTFSAQTSIFKVKRKLNLPESSSQTKLNFFFVVNTAIRSQPHAVNICSKSWWLINVENMAMKLKLWEPCFLVVYWKPILCMFLWTVIGATEKVEHKSMFSRSFPLCGQVLSTTIFSVLLLVVLHASTSVSSSASHKSVFSTAPPLLHHLTSTAATSLLFITLTTATTTTIALASDSTDIYVVKSRQEKYVVNVLKNITGGVFQWTSVMKSVQKDTLPQFWRPILIRKMRTDSIYKFLKNA